MSDYSERKARATAVGAVRPFRDADKSLLERGEKYRLEKTDQIPVILKVEHSVFFTLNNHSFGSKFVEDVTNLSDS